MKPYKTIKAANEVIKDLKYELQFSKNKVKDAKRINTLLDALKSFDDMIVYKYKTDAIETLIYSLIYELLLSYDAYNKEIPLNNIIKTIDDCFEYGTNPLKQQCISILKNHELNNKIKNNSVFDKDYINFDELLKNLMNEFKQNIKWNLTK